MISEMDSVQPTTVNQETILLSRPQDPFFKRVAEFEKNAKSLEKELTEREQEFDVN